MTEQSLFDACWQALNDGESLEAINKRYPDQSQELEPLLAAAGQLQALRSVPAPSDFRQDARARLLSQMGSAPQATSASYGNKRVVWWDDLLVAIARPFARPAWVGTVLTLFMAVLLLTSTTYAAQTTIPGDSLYSVKLISEQVWLRVSADSPDVDLILVERRLQEAQLLQTQNRHAAVLETIARYRQALDDWSERLEMAGIQDQDRVRQRLLSQLQMLQELGQSAPPEQQALLQEQHRATEQLMHRFGLPLPLMPQQQPAHTPESTQKQHQGGQGQVTPDKNQGTPQHRATPATPTTTPSRTPTEAVPATATKDTREHTPSGQNNQGTPKAKQTPDQPPKPGQGSGSPTNTPVKQAPNNPTSEPSPTLENTPTTNPEPSATPGQGGQGGGSQPTTSPGNGGGQSGGESQPTTSPAGGGHKGG